MVFLRFSIGLLFFFVIFVGFSVVYGRLYWVREFGFFFFTRIVEFFN